MEEHDKASKLTMWSKIKELISDGLNFSQIARRLDMHRQTVSLYASMSLDEFMASRSYQRLYSHKLDAYEGYVVDFLQTYPFVSAARVHDRLKEHFPDFGKVSDKTVFNFVRRLRLTHDIPKEDPDSGRRMCKLPETDYGEYAQVDFGESWMHDPQGKRLKAYFFVMVLSRSRYKYVFFSKTPFTTALAIYAHELAFKYFGGKPKKLIYDQDRVFIHDENLGDYKLTERFRNFVSSEGIEVVFCRKSDPQSKGKVENAVKYVKRNFLSAREFKDIRTLNAEALAWLERTANGTEHHGIRRIPAEVFAEEREWLSAYTGIPSLPEEKMELRLVRRDNTIMYDGCFYTVPAETYKGRDTQVYVEEKDGIVHVYDPESGKTIATHPYSVEKGRMVRNLSHLRRSSVSMEEYRAMILSMMPSDELSSKWLDEVRARKSRYFRDNLRVLERGCYRYDRDTLLKALATCIEAEAYNAGMLMEVAEMERIRANKPPLPKPVDMRQAIQIENDIPEKSEISTYDDILNKAI